MGNTKAEPYPFSMKERIYRSMSLESLRWAREDARQAMVASRGWNAPAECWYADDVHTIAKVIEEKCPTRR